MTPKLRILSLAFVVSLFLDQLTKFLVNESSDRIHFGEQIEVIEGFFYLTHVRNRGAAFGMLANAPETLRLTFFYGVSTLAIGIIISFFRKLAPGDRLSALALGLILGGSIGNLIDRLRFGEVVDFLHFKLWQGYSWPDFNLADSFIVIGVALLVLEVVATEGEGSAPSETA